MLFRKELKSYLAILRIKPKAFLTVALCIDDLFLLLILLMQGLIVSPLTSISHAPQLPVRQPVGISKPAFSADENQSSPSETNVSLLFGHITFIFFSFNLKMV